MKDLSGKKIVIAGFSQSGLAAASFLQKKRARIFITDSSDNGKLRKNLEKLDSKDIEFEFGGHSKIFLKGSDFIVVSPGISKDSILVNLAEELGIPLISEIELAYMYCPCKIIAITGSTGKSTVTSLAADMFNRSGTRCFALGNNGNPFSGYVDCLKEDDLVCLEVSSFQLEHIVKFKPKVSVILNISANHLDRHKDLEDYFLAKKRIFSNQEEDDFLLLNYKNELLKNCQRQTKAKVIFFNTLQDRLFNPNQSVIFKLGDIFGIDKSIILKTFKEFKTLEHRLEFVAKTKDISFINDSKSTTVDSAIWAFENIDKPIVLIAGGRDKGVDYDKLIPLLKKKARAVVLIGEARDRIESSFSGCGIPIIKADNLPDAVKNAIGLAKKNDCVLLSPMCSSYDMFKNFQERGLKFKQLVMDIK